MTETQRWFAYEQFARYIKYLDTKKYKNEEEKNFELYARDLAKIVHDANLSLKYPGNGPIA